MAAAAGATLVLASAATAADDGNLGQQLRIEQSKSRFQLMLEQVRESARLRAAEQRARAEAPQGIRVPADPMESSESVRLDIDPVTDPSFQEIEPESARRLRAEQAYERDQRRILDQRQRRSALVSRGRPTAGAGGYAERRARMVRFRTQDRRLSVQRKLRR